MHCLVAGWFSFEQMGATAGDLLVKDVVCERLRLAGISYDVAMAPPFASTVEWTHMNPFDYTEVIFVCGPFGNGWPVDEFLSYFASARLIGLNLSMLQSIHEWNPFHLLIERDSDRTSRPDMAFAATAKRAPVVGVILAHKQKEYGKRSLHEQADQSIEYLLRKKGAAMVEIDTALFQNKGGLTSAAQIESLIAKMDLVITTRLHGTVLSLKNGVPVIPIDPIQGGAKISAQVKTIGWPLLFNAGEISESSMEWAFEYCLSDDARTLAWKCGEASSLRVNTVLNELVDYLRAMNPISMMELTRPFNEMP